MIIWKQDFFLFTYFQCRSYLQELENSEYFICVDGMVMNKPLVVLILEGRFKNLPTHGAHN